MNLDKLIKLVKLANNNPNDNEANLAARKVCKMIAENNYTFKEVSAPPPPPPNTQYNPYVNPDMDFNDLFRKAQEAAAKAERDRAEARRRKEAAYQDGFRQRTTGDWPGGFRQGTNWWDNDPYNQRAREPYTPPDTRVPPTNPKPESRNLKCRTCKQMKSTKFQGYEAVFECNDCQWTAYERSKTSY